MKSQINLTNSEQRRYAKKLKGYSEVKNQYSHGQLIFTNGKYYISYDVDHHNGGFWKVAKSIKKLQSKDSREGTFDEHLNKIGK